MSQAAGIRTVTTRLLPEQPKSRRHHLLVQRFDVSKSAPAHRSHFHSLARLLHHSQGRAVLDYVDLFRVAVQLGVPLTDLREIGRRMLFNVLSANPDDHGRNHAFLYNEETRGWALTPAFDVTFHAGMLDRGLRIKGEVWPRLSVMAETCAEVGINPHEFGAIAEGVQTAIGRWPKFAKQARVPQELIAEVSAWHRRIRAAVVD